MSYSEALQGTGLRPTKRRRLDIKPRAIEHEDESTYQSDTFSSTAASDTESADKENHDAKAEGEKPKSKYKIHIPKNAVLPRDTFFTQPPHRSSSPYRIDDFHWRKPQAITPPSPSYSPALIHDVAADPHVSVDSLTQAHVDAQLHSLPARNDVIVSDDYADDLLDHMDPDAFAVPNLIGSQEPVITYERQHQEVQAPLANLKQTTLFGTQMPQNLSQTQSVRKRNWPLANKEEPATHHKLNEGELETWVYPTNLGTIRDYQYSIVAKGLYHNMLVALPTGLGKTFIAATVMLNWYRWTANAQIVFVAPSKPLVSQQVKACFEIAGIPRSDTSMLTGNTSPGLRAEEWRSKRVFFMTPQTIINDLKTGIADPKRLVLIVVDEAHRATGSYAYVEVVKFVRRFNSSFRVLALTATPGSSIETVQEVIDGLGISRIEIRTEESLDIRQYVHPRRVETVLFENSDEMVMVMDLFSKALQPLVDRLKGMNAYWSSDPMALTPYGCNQARQRWMSTDAGKKAHQGLKSMVNSIFALLASISQATMLLKYHGIGPFYHKVLEFRNSIHNKEKNGKYAKQVNDDESFQTMMSRVQIWINTPSFIGHPKLEYLQSVVLNHFLDAGEGRGPSDPSSTRVMIFAHFRDSAEEIARVLKRNEPMIRPHVFVGQANSKGSDGMDQKKQLDIIQKFKVGHYNTLVATSIGEEGLDIGEVDLIVCYDASASPIRMLQRMGRTGRKRAGNIVVTLMKGKEENDFLKAKDNYEKMQVEIASGARFNFHDEDSRRIVPKNIQPRSDKRIIDIPLENTQAALPEPTRKGKAPKAPKKKFHMPDGVRTGFVRASHLDDEEDAEEEEEEGDQGTASRSIAQKRSATRLAQTVPVPPLDDVILTPIEQRTFERKYLDIKDEDPKLVESPCLNVFPALQRSQRSVILVPHGRITKRSVAMLNAMHNASSNSSLDYEQYLTPKDRETGTGQADKRDQYFKARSRAFERSSSKISFTISPKPSRSSNAEMNDFVELTSSGQTDTGRHRTDFNDDELEAMSTFSSRSSVPPVIAKNTMAFDRLTSDDEDLPDFDDLVGKQEAVDRRLLVKSGRRRRVVEDDSDDE